MHGHAPAGSPDTWVFNIEAVSTLCIAAWYVFGVFISLGLLPRNRFILVIFVMGYLPKVMLWLGLS